MHWVYRLILLPYSLESGEAIKDTTGKDVESLSRWLFREVNPFSMGFMPDQATPSFMRAIVSYMTGQPVRGRLKPDGFILLNKDDVLIEDQKLRSDFIAESKLDLELRTLTNSGYKAIPDIRLYEGKYIACSIEVDAKNRNKISKFSRLSPTFIPQESSETLLKFKEGYAKMLAKEKDENNQVEESSVEETVEVDEIAF
jgi:hypothetical protein